MIADSNNKQEKQENPFDTPNENHLSKIQSGNSFVSLVTLILKNIKLNAPFPKELEYENVINYYPDSKLGFLNGYQVKDNEGVFSLDESVAKRQSGVFSEMAKQLAKGIFKTGTISLSLPVRIFEPRSLLERYTDWWSFAPVILKKAGAQKDKLEGFKWAITFTLSTFFFSCAQLKPFNPLLGETFQGYFCDGSKVYLEHTSHTPCVSNYYVSDIDGLYKYYGHIDISVEGAVKMLFNNYICTVQKGKNNIYLSNTQQTITFQYPKLLLGGVIMGSRYALWDGFMKFEDRQNNMKAYVMFNKHGPQLKNKRFHDIYGQIFHHDFVKHKKEEFSEHKTPKNPFPSDNKLMFSEITGSWLENINFNNKTYWNVPSNYPPQMYPEKEVIPSDSRYREDLIWLKRAVLNIDYSNLYEDYAQKWKVALEVQQRSDRAEREKHSKNKKK